MICDLAGLRWFGDIDAVRALPTDVRRRVIAAHLADPPLTAESLWGLFLRGLRLLGYRTEVRGA